MRGGTVPHTCVFCHNENTYNEYIFGVTNAKGEKYTVTFPESLRHYLDKNEDHPWKNNYHPPQWFIDDMMDPGTVLTIPPDAELKELRQVGYLTSMRSLQTGYGDSLLPGMERSLKNEQFTLDEVIDSQGTDGNVDNGSKAVFKDEPLPIRFLENLSVVSYKAFNYSGFERRIDRACDVTIESDPKVVTKKNFSPRPAYLLVYKTDGWSLEFSQGKVAQRIKIEEVAGLGEALKNYPHRQAAGNMNDNFSLLMQWRANVMHAEYELERILKTRHIQISLPDCIPKGFDAAAGRLTTTIGACLAEVAPKSKPKFPTLFISPASSTDNSDNSDHSDDSDSSPTLPTRPSSPSRG